MFEADAPSTVRALDELRIPAVRQKIEEIAARIAGSPRDLPGETDGLIAHALARVCDPERAPWDPARGNFVRHMGAVMREVGCSVRPSYARLGAVLREILRDDDPLALRVFDAISTGLEAVDAIAGRLGVPPREVVKARQRFVFHAARLKERDEAARDAITGRGAPAERTRRSRSNEDRS
jgi:hypothetical protein